MIRKHWIRYGCAVGILILCFIFFGNVYIHRLGAFGCFDDCFNIVSAYFLGQGKILYRDIFFNHMPLAAYVSFLIQTITNPQTFYQLILYHRIFILGFAFLWDIFFIFRFGYWWVLFGVLFEGTKFYVFGDRFLAEGMIIYPLVYMFILSLKKTAGKMPARYDYVLIALSTWFVLFMREPFAFLAGALFVYLLTGKVHGKYKFLSIGVFTVVTFLTFLLFPFKDFIFNVITINQKIEVKASHFSPIAILQMFFYPLFLFFGEKWNHFRMILIAFSILFGGLVLAAVWKLKQWKIIFVCLFFLGLANLRIVPVGTVYFDAFHLLPWYGMFLGAILYFTETFFARKSLQWIGGIAGIIGIVIVCFSLFYPKSFLYERTNTMEEFTAGYARYFVNGEVIRLLAHGNDTFYVEMWDDPLYWQAKLPSSYRYSWYTSIMPFFPVYTEARERMWKESPPDFYYGNCRPNESYSALLPEEMKDMYVQLSFSDTLSCIYIKKTKLPTINQDQWENIKKYGYRLL